MDRADAPMPPDLPADPGPPSSKVPRCLPVRFGGYELLAKLGEGGMGVVYTALQVHAGRLVALKRIRDGALASEEARRRFYDEAEAAARLDHPNIVPIYDVGEHEGQPYLTMKLMAGGTLADAGERFCDGRRAAALVATLARAVHEGHRQRVLHRDLKPENILFDDRGVPHIADFGVAKHLGEDGVTDSGAILGTAAYMAPEQARGQAKRATVGADVWSLGVILYELIAGRRPFRGPTAIEVIRRAVEEEPPPLGRLRRGVDRDLETVCVTCLRKEPERRYASAEALAEDLERYLRGEPVAARRPGRAERVIRWCARNPVAASILGLGALCLFVLSLAAVSTARAQTRARRDEVLAANVYAARAVAGTVLAQIEEYADVVAAEARAPDLVDRIARGDRALLEALCQEILDRRGGVGSPFASWFILDPVGAPRAHVPAAYPGYYDLHFDFRDYFRGALALAPDAPRPVYVSRAFRSASDAFYKFAIAAPIRGPGGGIAGTLVATIATDRRLGARDLSDDRRLAVLAGRRDRDAPGAALPEEHIVLVRDGVEPGEGIALESAALRRLTARRARAEGGPREQLHLPPPAWVEADGDYRDPLAMRGPGGYAGPWLAGVAPVGDTEFAVIVQTRLDDAIALDRTPLRVLAAWSVGGAALLLAGVFLAVRLNRARTRPAR